MIQKESQIFHSRNKPLTIKAVLTMISGFLQQAVNFAIGYFVTPIILTTLGKELFGAWSIIKEIQSYMSLVDLRPMGSLKLLLAIKQNDNDFSDKRKLIGAALFMWLLLIPIFTIIGMGVIYYSSEIIRIDPKFTFQIKIALGVVISGVILQELALLPQSVLRGQNLDYKAMGVTALIVMITGIFNAVVVKVGWGIIGLSFVTIIGMVFLGFARLIILRINIKWFGIEKPSKTQFHLLFQTSWWLLFANLGYLLIFSSDVLLVGYIFGPVITSVYVITASILQYSIIPLNEFLNSISPGMTGLLGGGFNNKVGELRIQSLIIGIGYLIIVGVEIIILNRHFINLWVGNEMYAGDRINILVIINIVLFYFFKIDNAIFDGLRKVKNKALLLNSIGTINITIILIFSKVLGLESALIFNIIFRCIIVISAFLLINRYIDFPNRKFIIRAVRPVFVMSILFAISYIFSSTQQTKNWIELFITALIILVIAIPLVWFLAFTNNERTYVLTKVRTLGREFIKSRTN